MKVLCLGNGFIEEDCFAKEIADFLKNDFDVVKIDDTFQLMDKLKEFDEEEIVIVDVVNGLEEVKEIDVKDLRINSLKTAHDFDAGFFLKLINPKNLKIIGLPVKGDVREFVRKIKKMLAKDERVFRKI